MGLNTGKIDDFSGGINMVEDPVDMDLNECYLGIPTAAIGSRNFEIIGRGQSISARRGVWCPMTTGAAPPVTTQLGNKRFTNMISFDYAKIICSCLDGTIYTVSMFNDPVTYALLLSGGGVGQVEWAFKTSQDSTGVRKVYMVNGFDTPRAYNVNTAAFGTWAGTPPNGQILASWKTRMWVSGVSAQPQRLYYSDVNNPESWPANNFIDIKSVDDDGDDILGLAVVGENLIVFKRNSVWVVFDPVSLENRRIAPIGILNRNCVASIDDQVYWAAISGIYSTDGDTFREEGKNIKNLFFYNRIGPYAKLVATHENAILFINFGGSTSGGVYMMYTELTREDGQHPWVYHGGSNNDMFYVSAATRISGDLLAFYNGSIVPAMVGAIWEYGEGAQRIALLYMANTNVDFNENSLTTLGVDTRYISPYVALQATENKERLRRVNLECRGTVTLDIFTDQGTVSKFTKVLNDDSSGVVRARPETRGRYHQVSISANSTVGLPMLLHSIELKYRGGKEH